MSEMVATVQAVQERPKIKKTDWFYYYLFYPVFLLPKSFEPNHVTYIRIGMSIPICYLMFYGYLVTAGLLLILAALMDGLDGAMARIRNQVSEFGKIVDPFGDKALNDAIFGTFTFLIIARIYPLYMVIIVLIDIILFFVSIIKYLVHDYFPNHPEENWLKRSFVGQYLINRVRVAQTGANNWGKSKMVVQIVVLSAMLLFNPNATYFIAKQLQLPWQLTMFDILQPLLVACVILGALSLYGHLKVISFKKA